MFRLPTTLPLQPILLVMVSIGVSFSSACDVDVITSRHSADAQASLDLFKKHVHPLFEEMRCASCHISKGSGVGAFADEDIAIAHTAALANQRVDFSDIENSKLVIQQDTSKHNCDKDSGECANNAEKLIAALTKWQESRDSAAEKSLRFTVERDADKDADKDATGAYEHELAFALNDLIDAKTSKVGNVTLRVTASKDTSVNLLTLKDFKISTTYEPIFLGGLIAKRNGKLSSNRGMMRVCALVETSSDDKHLTKFGEISFSLDDGDSSPNMIAFGLKDLRVATSEDTCEGESIDGVDLDKAKKDFNDKTSGIGQIISSSCTTSCHNLAAAGQGSDISTFGKFYTARQAIIRRVDCNLATSADKCMPKPQRNNLQVAQKQQLLDWLKALPE